MYKVCEKCTMPQYERVLEYIKKHGGITSLQAFKELGETRLSGKIYTLKKMGYKFTTQNMTAKNRYGKKVCFVKYMLAEE